MTVEIKRRKAIDSKNVLPAFALLSFGVAACSLIVGLLNMMGLWVMASKPVPAMVQLLDGRSVAMEPVDSTERTPAQVTGFVKDTFGLMFTWSPKLQPTATEGSTANGSTSAAPLDPGVSLPDGGQVTTGAWQASWAFSDRNDFRNQVLSMVAKLTPPDIFRGRGQSVLSFESVSNPRPIGKGKWQVDIVANLVVFKDDNPQGLVVPFNKTVTVESVTETPDPLPETSTPIQKAFYRAKVRQLQVIEFADLDIQTLQK